MRYLIFYYRCSNTGTELHFKTLYLLVYIHKIRDTLAPMTKLVNMISITKHRVMLTMNHFQKNYFHYEFVKHIRSRVIELR